MKTNRRFLSAAIFGFALALTFSCSGDGSGDDLITLDDKGNDIANYRTVKIGDQVWMAENLNYNVTGSKCYGEGGIVYDDEKKDYVKLSNSKIKAYCDKYGRLYNWATAMALPSSCNSKNCASQITAKHRGICPSGWHIPSNDDWDKLYLYEDGSGTEKYYRAYAGSPVAGKYLKATSGWNDFNGISGNGKDTYKFTALPGGFGDGDPEDNFYSAGNDGSWWSATSYYNYEAHHLDLGYVYDDAFLNEHSKSHLYSIRCIQDDDNLDNSNSNTQNSCPNAVTNQGTVSCGGQTYKTIVIGNQTWMAENLNYNVKGSRCYDNDPANCDIYGRLYDWYTAMALLHNSCLYDDSCTSQISTKHRGICPEGWHIPRSEDWSDLIDFVGGFSTFAALPGGSGHYDSNFDYYGVFDYIGEGGYWWASSESYMPSRAYVLQMSKKLEKAGLNEIYMDYLLSVRCLKD